MKKLLSGIALTLLLLSITSFASGPLSRKEDLGYHFTPQQQIVRRIAIILFNFQDNAVQPYTPDFARALVFTGTPNVNSYYLENSWNQISITGDAFGWYTVSGDSTVCGATRAEAARALAANDGYLSSNYDETVFLFPSSACGYGGLTNGPNIYINSNSPSVHVVGHEIGHFLGLSHANSLVCKDPNNNQVPLSDNCMEVIYGDSYGGIMGSGNNQVNSYNKQRLGLIGTQTIVSSGDYLVAPIEQQFTQAVRVPTVSGVYYWFEFRQPIGFDSNLPFDVTNGISIRDGNDFNGPTHLIYSGLYGQAGTTLPGATVWQVGQTFTDARYGISVSPVSISPSGAIVHVAFDPAACSLKAPGLWLTPQTQTGAAGQPLTYIFQLSSSNILACAPASYTITPNVPAGWTVSPSSLTETLSSGELTEASFTVTPKWNAKLGDYTISAKASYGSSRKLACTKSATYSVR
jgi:hypothetical protein